MVTGNKDKKTLRLANWQVYFLDKLYQLYTKEDLCDVTLKFSDGSTILAHKVVVKACTNLFEQIQSPSGGVLLQMPKHMKVQHVKRIINFMYTGKLEYMPDDQQAILQIAKTLGMTVLMELLQIQAPPQPSKLIEKRVGPKKYDYRPASVHGHNEMPQQPFPQPQPPETTLTSALPGKKLPIWKRRTAIQLPDEFYHSVNKSPSQPPVEDPKPTRFEWPEGEDLPDVSLTQSFTMDSFENLSYESEVIKTICNDPKPIITENSIKVLPANHLPSTKTTSLLGKRTRMSEVIRGHNDDDDDDDGHFETIHDLEDDVEDDESASACEVKYTCTPPKPILKTVSSPSSCKKVRFAESTEDETSKNSESQPTTPQPQPIPLPLSQSTPSQPTTPSPSVNQNNHSKILSEILKKYPDLAKNKKNIKVKIQAGNASPGSVTSNTVTDKDGKRQTKVQYIVLKSELSNLKKELKNEPAMGAENTTGPWICTPCADNNGPIHFDTYYSYRKHLQEVHNERIDARICEHCGFKASKRNLHLYHLYTKHNIPPPRNINFPKCDQCNYIALSESLLIKHRSNHTGMLNKEYICRICNAAFKSHGALMGHMQTNLHQTDHTTKKEYECEYCGKIFNRNINLKAHIRTSHSDESIRKLYDDEDKADDPPGLEIISPQKNPNHSQTQNVMEVIEVPVFDSVPGGNKTLYLPQGMTILAESPTVPLMPSSESEAMNNVATGIATSINIADRNIPNDVIVIDSSQEIIFQGTPTTYVLNSDGSYSLTQEYIVPDIMSDSSQVYATTLVSSAPTGISYVNSDNIPIISSTDHTYADGMKINGHVTAGTPISIVESTSQNVEVSQANQSIIVQDPIIVSGEWVQSIATSQNQNINQNQKLELTSTPISSPVTQVSSEVQTAEVESVSSDTTKTAQSLVSDWGDLDEDNQEESQDGESESEVKPSRPTIDLDVSSSEMDL